MSVVTHATDLLTHAVSIAGPTGALEMNEMSNLSSLANVSIAKDKYIARLQQRMPVHRSRCRRRLKSHPPVRPARMSRIMKRKTAGRPRTVGVTLSWSRRDRRDLCREALRRKPQVFQPGADQRAAMRER